jgi:hypothetical protein
MMNSVPLWCIACLCALIAPLCASPSLAQEPKWQDRLAEQLPLLGHRNWIVIADSAYPLQTRAGIETIATNADQLAAVKHVLAELEKAPHVRPIIHLDAELPFVPEADAPGIDAYRKDLAPLVAKYKPRSELHEHTIARLDSAAQMFRVVVLKTNVRLPYTSVFIELDCGYWSRDAQARLQQAMSQERQPTPPSTAR